LTQPVQDGKGLILETLAPGGVTKSFRIFPTTKPHFKKGHQVAWEWSMDKSWPTCWYRQPETDESQIAWISSAEFIGRNLDEL
jgi:hypothetical protein